MKTITFDTDKYLLPGDWNDLSVEQLFFLISLTKKNIPIQELKVKMLLFCLGAYVAPERKNRNTDAQIICIGKKKYPVTFEQMTFLSDLFNFLLSNTDEKGNCSIEPKLTRNPFPKTQCGCITVVGPDDGLTNITYEQFIQLQTLQSLIGKTPNLTINDFIAIIYKRNTFSTAIEGEPLLIKKMSDTVKTVIFWYYLGCLKFISEKFPRVFSGSSGSISGSVFENQQKIIDSLADGDVTKKPEVRASLLYDALFTLELAVEKQENLKSQSK